MLVLLLVQMCAVISAGLLASAPHPALASPVRHVADTVRVVLFDSLLQRPLDGATIIVSPGGATGITDSLGAVTVISTMARQLVIYHDVLDRIGIGGMRVERALSDSAPAWKVAHSVPSLSTMWARLCGAVPVEGRVIVGVVRTMDDRVNAAGARVVVQWRGIRDTASSADVQAGSARKATTDRSVTAVDAPEAFASRSVTADADGVYALCGVARQQTVGVAASRDGAASGNVLLPDETYPITRQDLVIVGPGDRKKRAVIKGTVADADGVPLAGVAVWVDGIERELLTNALGQFTMVGVPLGTRTIGIRSIGYLGAAQAVDVLAEGTPSVQLVATRVTTLDEMRVSASRLRRPSRERDEFEVRRAFGLSQIIDSTELAQYAQLRMAVAQLRNTEVRADARGDWLLLGRFVNGGRCLVYVYLDGTRLHPSLPSDAELMRLFSPDEFAAVEYFSSDAFAPARFRPLGNSCGILLLWTRHALR